MKADALWVNWMMAMAMTLSPQSRAKRVLLQDLFDVLSLYGYWDWKVLHEPLIRCVIKHCIMKPNY